MQIFEITICYFTPLFLVFGGSTPLECPHSRPPPVQTAAEIEQTRPVRELCSDWAKPLMVPAYHPKHAPFTLLPLSRPPRRSMLGRVRTGGRK